MKAFFLLLILVSFLPISLFAEDKLVAIATFVQGEAFSVRKGITTKIKIKETFGKEDEIVTKKGIVDLQVGPNSVIRVNKFSSLKLKELGETSKKQNIVMQLNAGQILGKVKGLESGSKYKIITKTTTAGVRGTEFVISEKNTEELPEEEKVIPGVYVQEGKIEVNLNGSAKTYNVGALEQLVLGNKQIQVQLLEDHMKQKMEILKSLEIMREENYKLLQEQKEKNAELLKKKN